MTANKNTVKEESLMRKQWWAVTSLLVIAMVSGHGFSRADEEPKEIVAKLKKKAQAVESYRADITIEMVGMKMDTRGKIVFKKPNKIRIETVTDMDATTKIKQIIVTDGNIAWTYQPRMAMVRKRNLLIIAAKTKKKVRAQKFCDISNPFYCLRQETISYKGEKEIRGRKLYVFQGNVNKAQVPEMPRNPSKVEVWIGANHGVLAKMIVFNDKGEKMMVQSHTNAEINVEIKDSEFELKLPEDVEVVDTTQEDIEMIMVASELGVEDFQLEDSEAEPGSEQGEATPKGKQDGTRDNGLIKIGTPISPPEEVWKKMVKELKKGNIEGALQYHAEESKVKYRRIYNDLGDSLPTFAAEIGTLEKAHIEGNIASCALVCTEGGETSSSIVYFSKDNDGNWKIYSY